MSTSTSSVRAAVRVSLFLLGLAVAASGLGVAFAQDENKDADRGRILGDRKCFLCHQDKKKSFPLSIHGSLHTGDDSTACESCHGPGERHMGSMGETKYIVQFEKLSPEAASKRCLTCHAKTAKKGSHIDGFLESTYLARGLGCTSCHDAHMPKAKETPPLPAPAPKPPMVGTKACLVCHSDRPGNVHFSHLDRVKEMLGCETCHGPGRAHAEARGKGPIRNPAKMSPPKSDVACTLCHSDKKAPEHFKPAPGKEKCADCHVIHTPPKPEQPAAAPGEPGRPPFTMAAGEGVKAPAATRRAFVRPSLPAVPEDRTRFAGLLLTGEIRGGFRYVDVDGNGKVYDQDLNYDTGPRLFDFSLAGALASSPDTKFAVKASGVDDPVESYSLTAEKGQLIQLKAKATRTNFVYHATSDPFDQSARKEQAGIDLTVAPEGEFRFSVGLDLWSREATRLGQRRVNSSPSDVKEPIDESSWYGWFRVEWAHGPVSLSATQGYRSEELDRGIETPGRPSLPTDDYLFYLQKTDVKAPMTTILGTFKPSPTVEVDGKIVYSPMDTDTSTSSRMTGSDEGSAYVEQVFGDTSGTRDYFRGELGATWFAMDDLTVSARFENLLSLDRTTGTTRTVTEHPTGSTPVTATERFGVDRNQRIWRGSIEARYRFADWITGRAGYEYGYEQFDVNYDVGEDRFHDTWFGGPVLGAELKPVDGLEIEALYRFVHVQDPDVPIGEENQDQASLKATYRVAPDLSLSAFVHDRYLTNGVHDTTVSSLWAGISAVAIFSPDLTVDAGWDIQNFHTTTDVLRYFAGTPVPGTSDYRGRTNGLHANATWSASDVLDLTAGIAWYHTTGGFATDLFDVSVGGEYRVCSRASVGSTLRFIDYNEDASNADDYRAFLAEIWMKFRF